MNRARVTFSILMIIVALTVVMAPAGALNAPGIRQSLRPDPSVVGEWSAPFSEGGAEFDKERPDTKEEADRYPAAVSIAVSPDGTVIYWNGLEGWEDPPVHNGWGGAGENSRVRILDLRDHITTGGTKEPTWKIPSQERGIGWDLFCSDLRNLADGRLMAVGGTHYTVSERWPGPPGTGPSDFDGTKETRIYDPRTATWSVGADMNHPRWYPSLISLADGKMLVAGGSENATFNEKLTFVKASETFDQDQPEKGWVDNGPSGETELPYYARLHLLPNGKVFYDASGQMWGPGPYYPNPDQPEWNWQKLYDPATKTWTKEGLAPLGARTGTFSVMLPLKPSENGRYDEAQILIGGGTFNPVLPGSYVGNNITEIVTAKGDSVTREMGPALNNGRWHSGGVVLPSGEVLALNGGDRDDTAFMGITHAVRESEMFDGEKWVRLASSGRDRVYHHTAVLLGDGSVLVGGHAPLGFTPFAFAPDNYTNGAFASTLRDPSFEIFKPPYLFRGERPRLTHVQSGIAHGESFKIATPDANKITSVVLSRLPSVTHLADVDQRTVELAFTRSSEGMLEATVPDNRATALSGHYYLFLMADNGHGPTPSRAAIVQIGETDHSKGPQPFSQEHDGPGGGGHSEERGDRDGSGSGSTDNHRVGKPAGGSRAGDHSQTSHNSFLAAFVGGHSAHAEVQGTLGGERGLDMALALAMVVLGGAAAILALRRRAPLFSKLASGALALQLGGLSWDMILHARAGEPMNLFENAGHFVAMGGILLLAVVAILPSIPTRFLPLRNGAD